MDPRLFDSSPSNASDDLIDNSKKNTDVFLDFRSQHTNCSLSMITTQTVLLHC